MRAKKEHRIASHPFTLWFGLCNCYSCVTKYCVCVCRKHSLSNSYNASHTIHRMAFIHTTQFNIPLPVLMSRPSPSHGLKKSYSADLSMYTWLLSINSTSAGLNRNTINFGPIHSLATASNSYIALFSKMVRKTSNIEKSTSGAMGECAKKKHTQRAYSE